MRAVFFMVASFISAALYAQPAFTLRGNSYVQRGILEYGGEEFPITAYVKHFKPSAETAVVVETQAGSLAKIVLDRNGSEISLEASRAIPERIVRKTILRDIRAVLGFYGLLGADVVRMSKDSRGVVATLDFDGYSIKFSDYKLRNGNRLLPHTIEICSDSYKLTLILASLGN